MKLTILVVVSLQLAYFSLAAFVDPEYKFVKWSGWGTLLGWYGKDFSRLNEDVQGRVLHALFSPDRLNLNIIRYIIGATSPENIGGGTGCSHCRNEVFLDAINKEFIWSRDAETRNMLLAAKDLGVDTFEAVARSPPYWMTRSNMSTGNPEGDNFDAKYFNAFADYLTEVIEHYRTVYNITFSSVTPFVYPSNGAFVGNENHGEGCNTEKETIGEVIKSLHAALEAKNMVYCNVTSAQDGFGGVLLLEKYLSDQNNIAKLYSKVDVGLGFTNQDKPTELTKLLDNNGHDLWMTEIPFLNSNLPNMSQGLQLASRIISDLRLLMPSAWIYFPALQFFYGSGSESLMYVKDSLSIEDIEKCSGYYVMMQFSKYIRKGFTLVYISDDDSVAAYDENSNDLVIVTYNPSSSTVPKTFDLTAFSSIGKVVAYRTSPTEAHVAVPPPGVTNKHINFELPAESVTTLKIETTGASPRINMLQNGDFENSSSSIAPWFLIYGSRQDNGVNGNYTYRGNYSGNIDYNDSKLTLMQNVTINVARTYHLSAWCATTGETNITFFGILVNGVQGPETIISHEGDYKMYGLSVDANPGDVLSIYLHSEKGNHTAQIDNVMFH